MILCLLIIHFESPFESTQWNLDHVFIGIQSWDGFLGDEDIKTVLDLVEEHCSEYEERPPHFLALQRNENSECGYSFHSQRLYDHSWVQRAHPDDEYANYCRFLIMEEDQEFEGMTEENRLKKRDHTYHADWNHFLGEIKVIEKMKFDQDIEIEWEMVPSFWTLIIEQRFIDMDRMQMIEEFPLCFVMEAPITIKPWHIPVHQC